MIIGVDFDGTIADTNRAKRAWIKRELGRDVALHLCDHACCVPLIGEADYLRMGQEVYAPESTAGLPPVPGVLTAVTELQNRHELVCVTARTDDAILAAARAWLGRFQQTRDMKVLGVAIGQTPKAEVCREEGIALLIDDDERHIELALAAGIGALLYKQAAPPELQRGDLTLCRSWQEVVSTVAAW